MHLCLQSLWPNLGICLSTPSFRAQFYRGSLDTVLHDTDGPISHLVLLEVARQVEDFDSFPVSYTCYPVLTHAGIISAAASVL